MAAAVITTSVVAIEPGTDTLVWTVQPPGDPDPEVDRRVDRAIRTMRDDLGL